MSSFKNDDDFSERLTTAAKAKQALLEKFRARQGQALPAAAVGEAAPAPSAAPEAAPHAKRETPRSGDEAPPKARPR
jgi:Family of unknown function (DUF6481)